MSTLVATRDLALAAEFIALEADLLDVPGAMSEWSEHGASAGLQLARSRTVGHARHCRAPGQEGEPSGC